MTDAPNELDSPDELLNHIWSRLASAVADRASGFRVATFCTITLDGSPTGRSIILRQVIPSARTIRFHTDRRSPKVAELSRDSRSALVFWDSPSKTQLRAAGIARVSVDDELTRAVAEASHVGSLAVYRSISAPSLPISSPRGSTLADEPLLENLAVVSIELASLEWLWLDDSGHRRCRFRFDAAGVSHQWLVP